MYVISSPVLTQQQRNDVQQRSSRLLLLQRSTCAVQWMVVVHGCSCSPAEFDADLASTWQVPYR